MWKNEIKYKSKSFLAVETMFKENNFQRKKLLFASSSIWLFIRSNWLDNKQRLFDKSLIINHYSKLD